MTHDAISFPETNRYGISSAERPGRYSYCLVSVAFAIFGLARVFVWLTLLITNRYCSDIGT